MNLADLDLRAAAGRTPVRLDACRDLVALDPLDSDLGSFLGGERVELIDAPLRVLGWMRELDAERNASSSASGGDPSW